MVASEVSIYNLALNAIGARNNITSPTEQSREAEVCRLWYAAVRDQILAAAFWPEATKIDYLALINAQTDATWELGEPSPGYAYAYALPNDSLRPQFLTDGSRFIVTVGPNNQRVLNSNTQQAILSYTMRQEVIGVWSSELTMAIVYGLAANICMPLSGKTQRARAMMGQANELILSARVTAMNTDNQQLETIPEWIAGRGYGMTPGTRFFYPFGSLLQGVPNVN